MEQNKLNMTTICLVAVEKHAVDFKHWGFSFMTENELDALRIAYAYRNSPHGVKVEHCPAVSKFMVTVWNAEAKAMGLDT